MKPLHTALLIIGAMLAGAGVTYWTVRQLPPVMPINQTVAPGRAPEPALRAAESTGLRIPFTPSASSLDESDLEAAIELAKQARVRGESKPLATTTEEFARQLGIFNYRIVRLTAAFPEPPPEGSAEAKSHATELDELTQFYANLTVDESNLPTAEDETAEHIAHLQAHLAGGSLELDAAGVTRLENLLRRVYQDVLPMDESDPAAEAKLDAATDEVAKTLAEFLSPEQKERLDMMGIDQVLFGLPQPEP